MVAPVDFPLAAPLYSLLQPVSRSSPKFRYLRSTDICGSVNLLGHLNSAFTRHPRFLTPAVQWPTEPSTSNVHPSASCRTAHLPRQPQLVPPRQKTPQNASFPLKTASTSDYYSSHTKASAKFHPLFLFGIVTKYYEQTLRWTRQTYYLMKNYSVLVNYENRTLNASFAHLPLAVLYDRHNFSDSQYLSVDNQIHILIFVKCNNHRLLNLCWCHNNNMFQY